MLPLLHPHSPILIIICLWSSRVNIFVVMVGKIREMWTVFLLPCANIESRASNRFLKSRRRTDSYVVYDVCWTDIGLQGVNVVAADYKPYCVYVTLPSKIVKIREGVYAAVGGFSPSKMH